jgi:hypothetical protein
MRNENMISEEKNTFLQEEAICSTANLVNSNFSFNENCCLNVKFGYNFVHA